MAKIRLTYADPNLSLDIRIDLDDSYPDAVSEGCASIKRIFRESLAEVTDKP